MDSNSEEHTGHSKDNSNDTTGNFEKNFESVTKVILGDSMVKISIGCI